MIKWETKNSPEIGKRVAIKLPDGRICSGKVNDDMGFDLEYVDNMDLLSYMFNDIQEWIYLE